MYLYIILSKLKSELISKVQKNVCTKDDSWLLQSGSEKQKVCADVLISQTDEEISKMSKDRFKTIVNQAVDRKANEYLNNIDWHIQSQNN